MILEYDGGTEKGIDVKSTWILDDVEFFSMHFPFENSSKALNSLNQGLKCEFVLVEAKG